jgi:NADPH:quinone reductase-like Zn-dependent oxidoreductase
VASRGTIVQVGVMGGGSITFNLAALMPKRARLVGTVLRARPLEEKVAVSQRFAAEVLPLFDSGVLRPVIDRRYPLNAIAEAHAYMETNANIGKIVIDVATSA